MERLNRLYFGFLLVTLSIASLTRSNADTIDSLSRLRDIAIQEHYHDWSSEWKAYVVKHETVLRKSFDPSSIEMRADSLEMATRFIVLAAVEYFTKNNDRYLKALEKGREIAYRNKFAKLLKPVDLRLAQVDIESGRYDAALKRLSVLLSLCESEKDEVGIAKVYLKIASLYTFLQDTSAALSFADSSILILKNNRSLLVSAYLEKSNVLIAFGKTTEASVYLDSALLLCGGPSCSQSLKQRSILVSAKIEERNGNIQSAKNLYLLLTTNIFKHRPTYDQVEAMVKLSALEVWSIKKHLDKSPLYLSKVMAEQMDFNELLLEVYKQFIHAFEREKNYDSIALYQELYIDQRDQIFGEDKLIRIAEVRAEFETRKEVNLISEQKELMILQEKALKQKMYINIAVGAVVVMLIGILIVLYRINKKRKNFNRNLDRMVQERTRELEQKHLELVARSRELELQIEAMYRQIQAPVSTMEGLYHIAQKDETLEVTEEQLAELKSTIEELKAQMASLKEFVVPFQQGKNEVSHSQPNVNKEV